MEVLSVGEKIKRARIYKGFTLKEVCNGEISVSKLSCIENGKIDPEDWVLEFIASKLELDINYLKKDVKEQIDTNIKKLLDDNEIEDYKEKLQYNLELSSRYGYYDLAFDIMHLIIEYLLKNDQLSGIQERLGKYFDLCNSGSSKDKRIIYFMDVAKFLYKNNEYSQAANYFRNIRKKVIGEKKKKCIILSEAICLEAQCYLMTHNYNKAYKLAITLDELLQCVESNFKKAEMYHVMAMVYLRADEEKFKEYEQLSYSMYDDNLKREAEALSECGSVMFEVGLSEGAVERVKKALKIYPKADKEKFVDFILKCIKTLIDYNAIDVAKELSEDALDHAITLDNIKFIEKAYYLKSKILQIEKNYISSEMYMNLSLDSLVKFGTKKEIYNRYMEMGEMYNNMGSIREALRYFSLAISLHKKL
ncbi:helix-turn-helix transcriptional regulator [Clostridium aestuarii]|uniref:Helix-turn-helix transcriptional regulator n=1 Tax=Clostridium aestuarii TaxID=338193 RepID=A0ABT4CZY5_9CLOT|nr:helix-turn-helix transcriptional regulator [Clostridium aestuarii]MCY6484547.1 helix-turn-helix transcriptional regulator [Clostridium aestuarii]